MKGFRTQASRLCRMGLSTLSPTVCGVLLFRREKGAWPDLKDPQTLDEKLTWLKLRVYEKDDAVARCADKYRVRDYVKGVGCGELLNTLIGAWDTPEEIPWETLPDRFVLKCSHGCGYNLFCEDRSAWDTAAASAQLRRWQKEAYWKLFAEPNYRHSTRRILCEAYLQNEDGSRPEDYKLYCFHGRPHCVMVCLNREQGSPAFYFFDRHWQLLRINPDGLRAPEGFTLPRPAALEELFRVAEVLSAPFPFVRVDLYALGSRVVFGELTFTPNAAMDKARLPETDRMIGALLDLTEPMAQYKKRKSPDRSGRS